MANRQKWTETRIERLSAEGRGEGSMGDYKPWIFANETNSLGRARRIYSNKTGRTHHLLSDIEYGVFLALEWQKEVIDIREQYPLAREHTTRIARDINVRHPRYPGTSIMAVMTTDFLVTLNAGQTKKYIALNAKSISEAQSLRALEKLEIQRQLFAQNNVDHHLIFDTQIDKTKTRNLEWIRSARFNSKEAEPTSGYYLEMATNLENALRIQEDLSQTLVDFCKKFDSLKNCTPGTSLRVARMLMIEHKLSVDLYKPNIPQRSLSEFKLVTHD